MNSSEKKELIRDYIEKSNIDVSKNYTPLLNKVYRKLNKY